MKETSCSNLLEKVVRMLLPLILHMCETSKYTMKWQGFETSNGPLKINIIHEKPTIIRINYIGDHIKSSVKLNMWFDEVNGQNIGLLHRSYNIDHSGFTSLTSKENNISKCKLVIWVYLKYVWHCPIDEKGTHGNRIHFPFEFNSWKLWKGI